MDTVIYAHVVSPNNYYADNLEFELSHAGYDVLNVYKVPEAKKYDAITRWETKGGKYKVLIGPVWNRDVKAKTKILDGVSELNFIYERITEDSKRLALFNKHFIDHIYSGKLKIEVSQEHYKRVYKLINYRYKNNYAAKERKEIREYFITGEKK